MSPSNQFDRHRCPPVPATARGTCRVRGCRRHRVLGNSTTAGQILRVARDPLDKSFTQVRGGVHLHVRTCTPLSNDGASSPARPSPVKAPYWHYIIYNILCNMFDIIYHTYHFLNCEIVAMTTIADRGALPDRGTLARVPAS